MSVFTAQIAIPILLLLVLSDAAPVPVGGMHAVFAAVAPHHVDTVSATAAVTSPRLIRPGSEDSLRVYRVDEVVIRRTRARRPDSPVAFTNLERDEIDRVSYGQDVPMALATAPGVYAFSDAANGFGYTYLKIRGFDQNRLGMLLNGVPLNDPEAHQVYWVDHGDILAGAQSVQIHRGLGANLFGATSFGGGVNIVTSPLAVEPGLHLRAGYGNYTESGLDLPTRIYRLSFASGPIQDGTAALYARYSRLASEGYRFSSGTRQESFALSGLKSVESGSHKIDLLVGSERTNFAWDGISPQQGFDLSDRRDRRFNPYAVYENNVDDFTQRIGSLTSEFRMGRRITLTNTVYYVNGEGFFEQFKENRRFHDYGFDPVVVDGETINRTDLVQRRWLVNQYWGLIPEIQILLPKGDLRLGVGARRYDSDHYGQVVWTQVDVGGAPLDRYYSYVTDKTSFEAYGQAKIPLRHGTMMTAALQYQGHRYELRQSAIGNFRGYEFEAVHHFVKPVLGVTHSLRPGVDLYASVGYAQREPSKSDYLDGDDPSSVPAFEGAEERITGLDKPIVKPESLTDYEAGISIDQGRWSAGAGVYWLDFRNELIPIDGGRIREEGKLKRANADRTSHMGLELEGSAQVLRNLRAEANLALSRHRFVNHEIHALWLNDDVDEILDYGGKVIPRCPERLANLSLIWSRRSASMSGSLRYVGRQYIDGENTRSLAIDPFMTVDLALQYELRDRVRLPGPFRRDVRVPRPLRLELRVQNALDTLYETSGYSYYDDFPARPFAFYWPGAPRSFFLSIETSL